MCTDLVIGMAGSGGEGIVSAGEALLGAAARSGYHGMMTKSFGSQIRGGECSCRVRLSIEKCHDPGGILDLLVVLNWADFSHFGDELPLGPQTVIIADAADETPPDDWPIGDIDRAQVLLVPIAEIAREQTGSVRSKNTVVLGLLCDWLGLDGEMIITRMRKRLAKKGAAVVEASEHAFAAGAQWAEDHPACSDLHLAAASAAAGKILLADGNHICAAAAIMAGCRFFGGYPITPSTEIMQFLAKELPKYGGSVLQCEDEIAGIGAAIGASFGGVKSMTATSGPGMSLKSEMMGLATMAELPLVIVNVQRGGPSTGLPTKCEQADLFQAVFSAHGDVMRPVLAATGVADMFATTITAFNLAEEYQTPVILLSDQEIGQRKETLDPIDTEAVEIIDRLQPTPEQLVAYERFAESPDQISPISHPGMAGGAYLASGIEHTERGAPSNSGAVHARMNDKRFGKFASLEQRTDLFRIVGDRDADLALISWGSSAGVCLEAVEQVRASGVAAKLLIPYLLHPVATSIYQDFLASVTRGLVVELSHQGQLFHLLRMHIDLPAGLASCCRSGAAPFRPNEIVEAVQRLLGTSVATEVQS